MDSPMTVGEAARAIQRSEGTVRNYVDRGLLRAVRTTAGQRLIERADVLRFRQEQQRTLKTRKQE